MSVTAATCSMTAASAAASSSATFPRCTESAVDAVGGVVEHRVDSVVAAAVHERLDVPGDVGGGEVVSSRGHAREPTVCWPSDRPSGARASGSAWACTTSSSCVARVSVT